ncbi:MAG: type I-D CRISPR-associated protein Cas5/Csc1 [Candidatus Jordarchaeum sp.]|uniref:type I-D CRISPR-associated protein Cas5/Csc1 n=1 Tax=Candidatus Jordarchaeum sp. TaxID=2823881 RepID=UPI00404B65E9
MSRRAASSKLKKEPKDNEVSESNMPLNIYRVLISAHDFLFYVTREYGGRSYFSPYLSNIALMYALNRSLSTVQRIVSGTRPNYDEDLQRFTLYATPAASQQELSEIRAAVCGENIPWRWNPAVEISFNAVDSPFIFSTQKESIIRRKFVLPKWGTYTKYPPLNTFEFFIIGGGVGPRIIRLGKKMVPVVSVYTKCENVKEKSGEFKPDHPVNWNDIKASHMFCDGNIVMQPWVPLIVSARLNGPYYTCSYINEFGLKREVKIAKPDPKIYPMVFH